MEIRRGKGVGLSIEEESSNPQEPHVLWIAIDHLLDNPYQHAEEINLEDYEALVESIRLDGFQGALNVSPAEGQDGYYFITGGGHQRRNAARDAGLEKLPVFVGASPAEKKQLGLRLARENTAQVNRSPVNLGFLYILPGIEAAAHAPTAVVIPGTISNGTPCSARYSASSPPRPNTHGSPPLSRTTVSPSRARFKSTSLIVS